MIEKYLLLTMQMSSACFTYTIFTLWTEFCCSIICIAISTFSSSWAGSLLLFKNNSLKCWRVWNTSAVLYGTNDINSGFLYFFFLFFVVAFLTFFLPNCCHRWLQSGILLFVIVVWSMFLSHTEILISKLIIVKKKKLHTFLILYWYSDPLMYSIKMACIRPLS